MKFMFKTFELFSHRNINDLIPEIIFLYLFEGDSLTGIELKSFKTVDYKGWLSKCILNFYGIDTERQNKGIYDKRSIVEVVNELYQRPNIHHIRVAKILKDKYL